MNVNMERTSFTSLLDSAQFGGSPQQSLMHSQVQPGFGLVSQPMSTNMQYIKQETPAPAPVKLPADQSVPNVLQNMMARGNSSRLTPSSAEASLLSLVDGELRVSSISNLTTFLKVLRSCKTEPEQTLGLVVLRATSTASDTKLAHACAGAFEKSGGLRLARAWVDSAITWQHNDLLVLLLEVLQTLPLQLTSITEARINEPIVKLRKNAREERVKRAAQDLLKFWRGKFTEKEKPSAQPSAAKDKTRVATRSTSKPSSSTAATLKQGSSTAAGSSSASLKQGASAAPSSAVPVKPKVMKKRTIKRLERLPYGGGSAVSKSSDLIGNLMQRKSAKDAAAAAVEKKKTSSSSKNGDSSHHSGDSKVEDAHAAASSSTSEGSVSTTSVDDAPMMALPTIQSFKSASSSTAAKERKRIRWADENGAELTKVKLIESWRDLVPHDPRFHDDQSFKDAKLREHANERHALLAQHHKVPPAVAASKSREWTTPAFIRLPEAITSRLNTNAVTDEMHVQDSRRRHVDEYEVLAGEMPIQSPKEWERLNEPHRGAPLEIPLSDVVESEPTSLPSSSAPMMAPPTSSAPPAYSRGYDQAPVYDQYNSHHGSEEDRKLREALGPLQENTVALLLDNPDVVPQVLDEAQHNGNRIPDARVFEIVDQYRRGRYPPNAGGPPPAYSSYGSQQQPQYGNMGPGAGFDRQYQQQYPPQQGPYMPGKRKLDAMGAPQNGGMPQKKNRGTLPCRYFASPQGCKHGGNCHYAHVQPVPANGPDLIYNNGPMPMMGGRGGGPMMGGPMMERYGPGGMQHGGPGHLMRGGR